MRRMGLLLLLTGVVGVATCVQGQNQAKWLVIAASQREVVPALEASRKLQARWPHATVVASTDCEGLRPGLHLAVAEMATNRAGADAALQKLKSEVPDAYVRECRPKVDSTLGAGVPLVDPSIADVPSDSVNWSDRDRVSSVVKVSDVSYVWIKRWYSPTADDPLEGRRESVLYFEGSPENAKELQASCTDAQAVQHGHLLALSCTRENAGDNLLHEITIFDTPSGKALKSVQRCREPAFVTSTEVTCKAESVNAQGKLKLEAKRIPL
jgi:hypothetical protein